jgi:hypothetical protein
MNPDFIRQLRPRLSTIVIFLSMIVLFLIASRAPDFLSEQVAPTAVITATLTIFGLCGVYGALSVTRAEEVDMRLFFVVFVRAAILTSLATLAASVLA